MNKYSIYFIFLLLTRYLRFYIFQEKLEFSGAVFTLFLIILIDKKINFWKLSGLFTALFFIDVFLVNMGFFSHPIEEAFHLAMPAALYYYVFFLICIVSNINKYNHGKKMIALLTIDLICNFFEALLKNSLQLNIVSYMIGVIIIRGIIVYMIFLSYKKREMLILQEEHQKKYLKLNLMASNLEAESFYLKKMSTNVENLMKQAYYSYKNVTDLEEAKGYFLDLSREIHELKKDYTRVITGLDNLFYKFEHDEILSLSKVGEIIKSNTRRYLAEKKLDISFKIKFKSNFKIIYYHKIFVIINNLVINAIEAMAENKIRPNSEIEVIEYSDENYIYITVTDNGPGIPEVFLKLIFNAGFSTKFDKETGTSSTGMGLSHVKNIVDEIGGDIKVTSSQEKGTEFIIKLPVKKFRSDTDDK